MPDLEDTTDLLNTGIFSGVYDDEDVGAEADLNNLETTMNVSPIPTTRIHKDHPKEKIIGDPLSVPQTRRMTKSAQEYAMASHIKKQRRTNYMNYQNCLFAYFLSQIEHKKVTQALTDPSWIQAMQDELLQFRFQKKMREELLVRNNSYKTSAQGYTLRRLGLDYDEMDVKSAFLYGIIVEEDGIFISQDKYVADILKKFDFTTIKAASTPIETNKALNKDEEAEDVDVHLYRSMLVHGLKRIFRYLKGQPKLGLWYPRDSPFGLGKHFSDQWIILGSSLDQEIHNWMVVKFWQKVDFYGNSVRIHKSNADYGFNFMNTTDSTLIMIAQFEL
ncbi:hypothetical protein Tco_0919060 [Tanacetum coccineum]